MKGRFNAARRLSYLLQMALWLAPAGLLAQSTLYNLGQIQKIEVQFSQSNWDYQMDTAKYGAEGYLMADWVKVNGIQYDSVGVKYKGNSSYDSTVVKNPIHIAMDEFKNQAHEGFTDIKLGNAYADPSMIREVLAYGILQDYMHCPRANFAQLYINGSYIGLYSNAESISKEFCSDHFYSSDGVFFKCNPIGNPSPTTKSNLLYLGTTDSTNYLPRYELKSSTGWGALVGLCDAVTNQPAAVGSLLDMDRAIWMLAFNDVMLNLDSYSGVFAQNYYLYQDQTLHFNPVIWDLNMAFGGFPFLGGGATGMGSLTVPGLEQLPITIHNGDPYWPLIGAILDNPRYKRMYIAHLRTITEEAIASGNYATSAASMQSMIDTAVVSDVHKFYSYSQFQNSLTTGAPNGSFTVPGISSVMTARLTYLQGTPEFALVAPFISAVNASPQVPLLDSMVTITATVSGEDSVFLGYRHDPAQKFLRVAMLDDGAHGDGAAFDGVYGANFSMSSAEAQYYVYAENADAGRFSPARAEHEFYNLQAALNFPNPGDVVINEFLAVNQTGAMDEAGQYEDWIELFNNTQSALSLAGLYLTDDALNPTKCALPPTATIAPQGLLIVWADSDPSTIGNLHCNFKLSSQGEEIMLSSVNAVMDSLVYGPQVADVSQGRCPDGTGSFSAQAVPSFDALNCGVAVPEAHSADYEFRVFPNPAGTVLHVESTSPRQERVVVKNSLGIEVLNHLFIYSQTLDVGSWPAGFYFVCIGGQSKKVMVLH